MAFVFDINDSTNWLNYLKMNGCVVISNVLAKEDIKTGISLFEQHLKTVDPNVSFNDPRSLNHSWPDTDAGFVSDNEIHQSRFVWFSRSHPQVLDIYRQIYKLDSINDLVTAFDRANAIRNMPYGKQNEERWTHIDYPINDPPPFDCFQSFLNYIDCTSQDSPCLRVCLKSHKDNNILEYCKKKYSKEDDGAFFMVDKDYPMINVLAPAGLLVIWNSQTLNDSKTWIKSKKQGKD